MTNISLVDGEKLKKFCSFDISGHHAVYHKVMLFLFLSSLVPQLFRFPLCHPLFKTARSGQSVDADPSLWPQTFWQIAAKLHMQQSRVKFLVTWSKKIQYCLSFSSDSGFHLLLKEMSGSSMLTIYLPFNSSTLKVNHVKRGQILRRLGP